MTASAAPEVFVVVYDFRDRPALQAAYRHRDYWGKLYTDIHALDADHVALVFRPAPDARWRGWEQARLELILDCGRKEQVSDARHGHDGRPGLG